MSRTRAPVPTADPTCRETWAGHFFFGFYESVQQTLASIPDGRGGTVLDRVTTGPTGVSLVVAWGGAAPEIPIAAGPHVARGASSFARCWRSSVCSPCVTP